MVAGFDSIQNWQYKVFPIMLHIVSSRFCIWEIRFIMTGISVFALSHFKLENTWGQYIFANNLYDCHQYCHTLFVLITYSILLTTLFGLFWTKITFFIKKYFANTTPLTCLSGFYILFPKLTILSFSLLFVFIQQDIHTQQK